LLAPAPIKNSILSIAKSPNLQKTLDFPAGSQYIRRDDEWFNFLHLGPRRREAPSQSWRTFLDNHLGAIIAIKFFTVPPASFRVLFVMVALAHYRRRIDHLLSKDAPEPRAKQPPNLGAVIEIAEVGGSHHRYERRAA
jgi:hypothetical protein